MQRGSRFEGLFGRIPSPPCSPLLRGGAGGARGRCVTGFASLRATQAAINRGSTTHLLRSLPPTLRF